MIKYGLVALTAAPAKIRFLCPIFPLSCFPSDTDFLRLDFIISYPIQAKKAPPIRPIAPAMFGFEKKSFRPKAIMIISRNSNIPCPKTTNGPAINPFLRLPSIVIPSIGPGIIAPENPIKNALRTILHIDTVLTPYFALKQPLVDPLLVYD